MRGGGRRLRTGTIGGRQGEKISRRRKVASQPWGAGQCTPRTAEQKDRYMCTQCIMIVYTIYSVCVHKVWYLCTSPLGVGLVHPQGCDCPIPRHTIASPPDAQKHSNPYRFYVPLGLTMPTAPVPSKRDAMSAPLLYSFRVISATTIDSRRSRNSDASPRHRCCGGPAFRGRR